MSLSSPQIGHSHRRSQSGKVEPDQSVIGSVHLHSDESAVAMP
jgi:hypothetical protein